MGRVRNERKFHHDNARLVVSSATTHSFFNFQFNVKLEQRTKWVLNRVLIFHKRSKNCRKRAPYLADFFYLCFSKKIENGIKFCSATISCSLKFLFCLNHGEMKKKLAFSKILLLSVITFLKVWFCSADAGPINTMLFRQVLNRHSRYILKSPSHYNLMPSLDIYIPTLPSISTRLVFKLPLQCNCDMMGLTLGEVQRSFSHILF